jgi:hypothetical protein
MLLRKRKIKQERPQCSRKQTNLNCFSIVEIMVDQTDYGGQFLIDLNSKIRDIEEKQKILRDRLLLIGQNLVEIKEGTNQKMLEIRKDVELMKQAIERLSSFLETVSGEFSKFAKKEDLDILIKQAKMFQPLEFIRRKDSKTTKKE